MEITVVFRGSFSVSALSGGSLVWSRKSVARNLCGTVSLGCQKSEVQRERSAIVKRPSGAGLGISLIQCVRLGGRLTDDMAVLMRIGNLDSFRYKKCSERFDKSQELTSCLQSGNNVRYARSLVSFRRTVPAQFHSFCSGTVLFSLAIRFHTASVQKGRYICETGEENAAEQSQAVKSSNVYTDDTTSHTQDETEDEVAGGVASSIDAEDAGESRTEYWVVNFYYFVSVDDPHLEVARHTEFLKTATKALNSSKTKTELCLRTTRTTSSNITDNFLHKNHDVCGRIYISEQGINAQLSSRGKAALVYAHWVKEDPRFSDLLVQTSPSFEGHAFPRLRLRYKPSLVQVEGGTQHLPVTDPAARAVPLSPAEWKKRLDGAKLIGRTKNAVPQGDRDLYHGGSDEGNLSSSSARQVVLLDVRNGYEWDVGHFKGAERPNVDCFQSTAFGLSDKEDVSGDPLADVDREKVDVMMYCTGGIRCDVYSTMLRAKGFKNLYSLKGGVSNYLKEEGVGKWAGNLFVFDSRLAVPPKSYNSKRTEEGGISEDTPYEKSLGSSTDKTFARCLMCGDPLSSPRHRNCANVDCNQLYLSCDECLPQYKGCCSHECSSAPKLRPLMISIQQYERWHKYRSTEPPPPKPADYVSRRAMKRRRRKERRKQLMLGDASKEEEFERTVQNAEMK